MPNVILSVDPGSERSALVVYELDSSFPLRKAEIMENHELVEWLYTWPKSDNLIVEMMKPRGMPTSWHEFLTCVWIGRFIQARDGAAYFMFRHDVKMTICNNGAAKDSNIRAALIDHFGGKERAIGKKKTPGPLYGVVKDLWSALAIAVTFEERPEVVKLACPYPRLLETV